MRGFRLFCREMCSFQHPAVASEGTGPPRKLSSLKELKRVLDDERGLQFCKVCLAGRKVQMSVTGIALHGLPATQSLAACLAVIVTTR